MYAFFKVLDLKQITKILYRFVTEGKFVYQFLNEKNPYIIRIKINDSDIIKPYSPPFYQTNDGPTQKNTTM